MVWTLGHPGVRLSHGCLLIILSLICAGLNHICVLGMTMHKKNIASYSSMEGKTLLLLKLICIMVHVYIKKTFCITLQCEFKPLIKVSWVLIRKNPLFLILLIHF